MKGKLTPALLARTYSDPLALANLAVDLLPVLAILFFGWGAAPLVALYWLENIVIGLFTAARMIGAGLVQAGQDIAARLGFFFLAAFFCVHYGAFCWGHGVFLSTFADADMGLPSPASLISWTLGTGPYILWFLGVIFAMNVVVYVVDFVGRGEIGRVTAGDEMARPYGRIMTLHVAIILGAVFAFNSDEPLLGVFLLIVIRVVFGVFLSVRSRMNRDAQQAEGVAASTA